MIGFSYSLGTDGAPGEYNKTIPDLMARDYADAIASCVTNPPWVGMQWEIWDALDGNQFQDTVPELRVAAPPRFTEKDILHVADGKLDEGNGKNTDQEVRDPPALAVK